MTVVGGPVQADGCPWWHIQGTVQRVCRTGWASRHGLTREGRSLDATAVGVLTLRLAKRHRAREEHKAQVLAIMHLCWVVRTCLLPSRKIE